jgi:ATP-dependent DNA helicase RecQ
MMRGYAETSGCRRAFVLSYFGEPFDPPCGNCDNCLEGRAEAAPDDVPSRSARVWRTRTGARASSSATTRRAVVVLFDEVGYKTLAVDVVLERALLRAA